MPITTKAEAEALSVPELKVELEARGLPSTGLKAGMLEVLLAHMDGAANGEPAQVAVEGAEEPKAAVTAEAEVTDVPEGTEATVPADSTAPPATEAAVAGSTDEVAPASDVAVTRSAVETAPTRTLDEVSGDTEEPDSKKAKADTPEEVVQPTKTVETATEAPSSEPASAPVVE